MKNAEKLVPINDTFTYEEATEILLPLLNARINFHNIKNWSSNERFGKNDETAQVRLPLLRKEVDKLTDLLSDAKKQNKRLVVTSEISIALSDY